MLKKILSIICLLFLCGCGQQNKKWDVVSSYIEEKNYIVEYKDTISRFDTGEFENMSGKYSTKMIDGILFEEIETAYIRCYIISLLEDSESWEYLIEFKAIDEDQTKVILYY